MIDFSTFFPCLIFNYLVNLVDSSGYRNKIDTDATKTITVPTFNFFFFNYV